MDNLFSLLVKEKSEDFKVGIKEILKTSLESKREQIKKTIAQKYANGEK